MNGYSRKEHIDVANWKNDLNSTQFRIINNTLAESLKLYEFQKSIYEDIQRETEDLLENLNKY